MTEDLLRRVRFWLAFFMAGLVFSGITAFPLETELARVARILEGTRPLAHSELAFWIYKVRDGLAETNRKYPFLAYGTDWLAFAHLVIAAAFIGAWREPVRNKWLFDFGLMACVSVIPLALIAGELRGIPWFWRMIDSSFGVFGTIPMVVCRRLVLGMEKGQAT